MAFIFALLVIVALEGMSFYFRSRRKSKDNQLFAQLMDSIQDATDHVKGVDVDATQSHWVNLGGASLLQLPNNFFENIKRFNALYKMPTVSVADRADRLTRFHSIIAEELEEILDIDFSAPGTNDPNDAYQQENMVKLFDLLGDIIVYCASEGERWGYSLEPVLDAIMKSNFSKLQADGTALYDERGKLLKGSEFVPPEELIHKVLFGTDK